MSDRAERVRNDFIAKLKQNKTASTIYLVNGIKLTGKISDCDDVSLLLYGKDTTQLIMFNAIATIMPTAAQPQPTYDVE